MEWLINNWDTIIAAFGAFVAFASVVVKLTPTKKDEEILAKLIKILEPLSLFNRDGTMGK